MKKYKVYKEPKPPREKKYNKNELTDNVRFNENMSPLYFVVITLIMNKYYGLSLVANFFSSAVFYGFCSTVLYLFASNYFQPDLDVMTNRPGMGHFPFGRWMGRYKLGRVLKMFVYPINRLWYWFWHPYGRLLTHRGAGHWPVWGVWIRIAYIMIWFYLAKFILLKINIYPIQLSIIETWLNSFFPWDKNFFSFHFLLFCFPIYLSDTVHIGVDYFDSVKRSLSFCPPRIPRGLIMKTINTIRGVR